MSVRHFCGHRLWRLSFLLFGHPQWRPLSFHFMSSHHFSGRRLWRFSFLYCHRILIKIARRQWGPLCVQTHIHTYIHTYIFHVISSRHFSGHRLLRLSFLFFGHRQWRRIVSLAAACGDSVFFPVVEYIHILLTTPHQKDS